jgi:hypothetical protein
VVLHGFEGRGSKTRRVGSNFRAPDIGACKNVRFKCRSGLRGSGGGVAFDRRAGECEPDTWWRTHREAHAQARAGEDGRRLVEDLTKGLSGERAMRRA